MNWIQAQMLIGSCIAIAALIIAFICGRIFHERESMTTKSSRNTGKFEKIREQMRSFNALPFDFTYFSDDVQPVASVLSEMQKRGEIYLYSKVRHSTAPRNVYVESCGPLRPNRKAPKPEVVENDALDLKSIPNPLGIDLSKLPRGAIRVHRSF